MNPSMLFRYSDNRIDFETPGEGETVCVNFWTTNGKTQGHVRLDENEVKELVKFLNQQIEKMKPTQPSVKTQTKK